MRHFKCAPFSFIGRIGEKLFGLRRKKSIDLAHRNHIELICQVNNSFGKIAGQFSKLWSVTRTQNDALRKTIGRIDNQEKQIQNLTESMRKKSESHRYITMISGFTYILCYIVCRLIKLQCKQDSLRLL